MGELEKHAYLCSEKYLNDSEMKTSEAIRKLKKAGCYFVEHGGEHDCWFSTVTNK